jgi:hypothetical protein
MSKIHEKLRDIARENRILKLFDYFTDNFKHPGSKRKFTSKYCQYLYQIEKPICGIFFNGTHKKNGPSFLNIYPTGSNRKNGLCFALNGNLFLDNYKIYGITEDKLMSFLPDNIKCTIHNPKYISKRDFCYFGFFKTIDDIDKFINNVTDMVNSYLKSNMIKDICEFDMTKSRVRIVYFEDNNAEVYIKPRDCDGNELEKINDPLRSIIVELYHYYFDKISDDEEDDDINNSS